ncbi:MFS transporter [Runella zeae]|uniref:MFS transporter n=1 Tax=Runella zeae TaxID=94255 RepID=UPI0004203A8B|nr:MFS transporter [Runella zeae]
MNNKFLKTLIEPFQALRNKTFAKLYLAQTISLIGDAFTWVGLALLAYEIDKERSSIILATALTLRVTAFIVFSPFAGVLADRVERKKILYFTHFVRMSIVACLPFITSELQIYGLVFFLNVFNAFFTPTYRAIIPQIVVGKYFREAIRNLSAIGRFRTGFSGCCGGLVGGKGDILSRCPVFCVGCGFDFSHSQS